MEASAGAGNDEVSGRIPCAASIDMSADMGPAQLARIEHAGSESAGMVPRCIGQAAPSDAAKW